MNSLVLVLIRLTDPVDGPAAPNDVKAGWGAFGIFLLLAIAVALLCFSMVRHMKKAQANADAGLFGEDAAPDA